MLNKVVPRYNLAIANLKTIGNSIPHLNSSLHPFMEEPDNA